MKQIFKILLAILIARCPVHAQQLLTKNAEEQIIALEKSFADIIKARDTVQASNMQLESYFLAVGIQGKPLRIVQKSMWLSILKNYVVESYSIDDIRVNVYDNTAVALLLLTQKATTNGVDRTAQFYLTDIWVKRGNNWLIAERHSSRPEIPVQAAK